MTFPRYPLRIGTRASPLALAQAELVRDALCASHNWSQSRTCIVPMTASGDKITNRSLADIGGKALWTKELDQALFDDQIDLAVHSMKDVETIRPTEFCLAAMLVRGDVRDRLVGAESLSTLKQGAVIGTNSPRRTAQLSAMRPDLKFTLFRGNVATRLERIRNGAADATLLAAAGLDRLGLANTGAAISVDDLLPAPAQGAIGIETLGSNPRVVELLSAISHGNTMAAVLTERALLAGLSAGCHSPVAALATASGDQIILRAEILQSDGSERVSGEWSLESPGQAQACAIELLAKASSTLRTLFNQ